MGKTPLYFGSGVLHKLLLQKKLYLAKRPSFALCAKLVMGAQYPYAHKPTCSKLFKYVLCPMESSEIVDADCLAGCERSESNFQCPAPAGRRHDATDFHRKKCTFLLAIYIVSRNGTRMRFMPFSSTVFTQRTNARRAAVNAWLSMPRIGQSW